MNVDLRAVRAVVDDRDRDVESRVERAVGDLRRGEMIVLDGRVMGQGLSQLVVAGVHADAAAINRMTADARGLVSLAMTASHCDQLELVDQREGRHATSGRPFTVSIEARHGVTTGISARDRAVTVAAAIAPDASRADIVMPGHVVPVRSADGGVAERPRHAEASIDLVRLAGVRPAAVACTMLDDRGEVADWHDIVAYAERHGLVVLTIGDVLAYRRRGAERRKARTPADGRA